LEANRSLLRLIDPRAQLTSHGSPVSFTAGLASPRPELDFVPFLCHETTAPFPSLTRTSLPSKVGSTCSFLSAIVQHLHPLLSTALSTSLPYTHFISADRPTSELASASTTSPSALFRRLCPNSNNSIDNFRSSRCSPLPLLSPLPSQSSLLRSPLPSLSLLGLAIF
jgi:hypothetical protein